MGAKSISFSNFVGGLWVPAQGQEPLPATALQVADNVEYFSQPGDDGGLVRLRGRRGRSKWNATPLSGASDVLTLHRFYPRVGSPSTLAAYQDGANVNFRHDTADNGVFGAVTGSFNAASGKRWRFVNWPQKEASFGVNGTNGLYSYNGTLAAVSITGVAVDGPYIALWKNRLWATKAAELPFSIYASALNDATNWNGAQQLSLNDATGNLITGITPDPTGDYLLATKEQSLWRYWGDIEVGNGELRKFSDQGCVAPDSLQLTDWGILYVGRQGVFLNSGATSRGVEVSAPIRGLFRTGTTDTVYTQAVGFWFRRKQQYWLKLHPADTWTYILQRVPLYNPMSGQESGALWLWSRFLSMPLFSATAWDGASDDGRLLTGDRAGQVWRADNGNLDDGAAYAVQAKSFRLLLDAKETRFGRVASIEGHYAGNAALPITLSYDESAGTDVTISLGANQGDSSLQRDWKTSHDYSKNGQYALWGFTFSGDAPQFELRRLDFIVHYFARKVWR